MCAPNEAFCTWSCSVPHANYHISVTTLLLACPQLQEGAAPSVADTAGNNLHSTPACCSAQQTAATALPEFCNAELHGRLCSQFDGLRWYIFHTHFLLCLKRLYCIFDCYSRFLCSLWYFLLSRWLECSTVLICSTEDLQYKSWLLVVSRKYEVL